MADDTTSRHAAQLARDYLAAVWSGDPDAAQVLKAELARLERERARTTARDAQP